MRQDWTDEDLLYLKHHYEKLPTKTLASRLGRTKFSIIGKAYRLGLCKPENDNFRKPYLDEYCHGQGKHQLLLLEDKRSWKEEDSRPRLYVV